MRVVRHTAFQLSLMYMLAAVPAILTADENPTGTGNDMPSGQEPLMELASPPATEIAGGSESAEHPVEQGPTTLEAHDIDELETSGEVETPVAQEAAPPGVACEEGKVCRETATGLPLRILPRPFSNLYKEPVAQKENVVKYNLKAFHPWYVFQRKELDLRNPAEPKGWYRVGKSQQKADGWIRAADAFEWRQALLVSYTHPGDPLEGRKPVLMFSERGELESLLDTDEREEMASELYAQLEQKKVPPGVISMEPRRFVDINEHFYLLPILQFETVDLDGDEARLLQIAAAVPGARGPDTLANEEYASQAGEGRGVGSGSRLKDMQVDVVFVMDTTGSMQPYIDMTRDAVAGMVARIGDKLADRVKFGLVGYRDSLQAVPALGYTARNFTPQLVDGKELVTTLAQADAAKVGSKDYQEEVFAGIDEALDSAWRDNAMKFIVLIGDASSHVKGHEQNTTGRGAEDLLRELDDAQIHVVAIHLEDPRAAKDFALAETQFRTLSRVRGSEEESAYLAIDAFKKEEFAQAVDEITRQIGNRVDEVLAKAEQNQPVNVIAGEPSGKHGGGDADTTAAGVFDKAWNAALVEYLGQGARPPKDIVAWVLDRDLTDPALRSLDVRLLITRTQLSSLVQALDRIIQALMRAEVTQEQFFQALQGVAGQAMKRPEDIGQAQRMVDTGLLPAFIESLPYKSDILSLTEEMFGSMTADDRAKLQWDLLAKLKQYQQINEQVDAWKKLNESDPESEMVYPLNIDYLP